MENKDTLIQFCIDVIQTYGYDTKFGYYTGGYSTQEEAFRILYDLKVIKRSDLVRNSEIKAYWKEWNKKLASTKK